MQILLYEFITAGGWHSVEPHSPPSGSLLAEGTAMRDALAADLAAIPAVEVTLLHDSRLPEPTGLEVAAGKVHRVRSAEEHREVLLQVAHECDAAILIAPEFDGHLTDLARTLEATATRLLSPSAEFVQLASSKHATASHLAAAGLAVPLGCLSSLDMLRAMPHLHYPSVLKPNDGAGSLDIKRLNQASDLPSEPGGDPTWRWEEFVDGTAASVAMLCGATPLPCPACYQHLSDDGNFTYHGGRRIADRALAQRAEALALQTVAALPATAGYVGVDMVLGERDDGSADVVLEVNPRLTTSYVGLRQLARGNLAQAMLQIATGTSCELSWSEGAVQFEADGTCHAL